MKKRLFVAIFGLLFVLLPFVNTEALAFLSIVTAKQCPIYLVLEEKDGIVSQAYLGTPAGSFPIKSVEGYRTIQEVLLNAKNDEGINRFLWRLEFAKPDDPRSHAAMGGLHAKEKYHRSGERQNGKQ